MFKVLSDDDIEKAEAEAFEVWKHTPECEKALDCEYQWYLLRDRTKRKGVAQASLKDALRQFVEWIEANTFGYDGNRVLIGGSIQYLKAQLEEKK